MFRKNKDEKVFRYSIRKYHFGAASVAVAALMFLGVRAEVVKANTSLDVAQATLGSSDSATGQSDEASRAVASTPVSAPTTASSETTPAEAETSATKVDKTKLQANYDKLLKLLPESGLQGEALENAKTLATKVQVVLADDSASAEAVEKAEKVLEEVLVAIENAQAKKAEETKSASTSSEVAKAEPVAEKQATAETGTPAVAEEAEKTEAKAKLQVSLERLEQAITQTPDHDLTRDILEKALAQVTLAKAVLGNTEVSLREIEDMNRAVKKSEGSVMIARNRLTSGRNDARNGKKMAEGVQFRAEVANSYQDTANNGNILYIATQMRGATDPASAKQIVSDSIQYKTRFNKNSNGKIISVDWMVYFNNHVKNFSNEYGVAGELYENYFQVPNEVNMPQNIQRVQYKVVQKLRGGRFRRIEPNGNPLSNEVTFDNPNPNTAVGGVELQKNENLTRDSWSSYSRGYANLYANRNRVYNDAYSKVPETKKHIENSAINAERVIWDDSNTAGNWKDAYIWRFTTTVPDRTTNEQLKNMKIVFGMYRKNTVGNYSGVHAIAANPVNLSAADVAKDFTPVKPADKLPVATPGALSQKEQNDLKAKVQAANPGKTVVVDPSGKATVTDPATGISHEIPSSDLVEKAKEETPVTPVKPVTPAKTEVKDPEHLTDKEKEAVKDKVEKANPGKNVTVDDQGNATVTDPTNGSSATIPSSDLVEKAKEETPVTPVKPVTPANDQATAQTNTRRAAKELPNTGTADSAVSMVAAAASALIGLGLAGRRRKEDEE